MGIEINHGWPESPKKTHYNNIFTLMIVGNIRKRLREKHSHIRLWSIREQSAPYPLLKKKQLQVVGEIDLLTHNHLMQEWGTVQYDLLI